MRIRLEDDTSIRCWKSFEDVLLFYLTSRFDLGLDLHIDWTSQRSIEILREVTYNKTEKFFLCRLYNNREVWIIDEGFSVEGNQPNPYEDLNVDLKNLTILPKNKNFNPPVPESDFENNYKIER